MNHSTDGQGLAQRAALGGLLLALLPGCGLLVAGVAVAGGALLAVNVTAEDTVSSQIEGIDPDRVFQTGHEVLEVAGWVRSRNDLLREAEAEIEGDQVRLLVRPRTSDAGAAGCLLEVRARTLAGSIPAPERARQITRRILDRLGLSLRPEAGAGN